MKNSLHQTIKQLLNLVLFCKKVNIPFDVYAFSNMFYEESGSNEYSTNEDPTLYKNDDIRMKKFHLLNLFSNKMSSSDLAFMASVLLVGAPKQTNNRNSHPSTYFPGWMGLHFTPLNEAIFSAMQIIPKFQKDNKLQVVNTVFLTDGDGHQLTKRTSDDYINDFRTTETKSAILRHSQTGYSQKIKDSTNDSYSNAALQLLKRITNCNVVGFYLMKSREFYSEARRFYPSTANTHEIREKFMKEKSVVCTSSGYDEFYIIRAETDVDDDDTLEVKSTTTKGLINAFTKYNTNKIINRVVLNKFIGMIT
jgi:hypothetical protein